MICRKRTGRRRRHRPRRRPVRLGASLVPALNHPHSPAPRLSDLLPSLQSLAVSAGYSAAGRQVKGNSWGGFLSRLRALCAEQFELQMSRGFERRPQRGRLQKTVFAAVRRAQSAVVGGGLLRSAGAELRQARPSPAGNMRREVRASERAGEASPEQRVHSPRCTSGTVFRVQRALRARWCPARGMAGDSPASARKRQNHVHRIIGLLSSGRTVRPSGRFDGPTVRTVRRSSRSDGRTVLTDCPQFWGCFRAAGGLGRVP